ncbi:TetR/AcrR family transcriptional regulator [Amycolatopsis sp. K13G38]|uniref:TetR/AcrR family transcriptional regulator n=1 Tax=Amycolatopsis acididurans TaxID=2724524 RepID=A0ABX1JH66_9PSEU|nr:TetR/AcrR family transcriptional regulator [Amycolatopsis acididurans]NKQ57760.1 TetR/AcrR family transcriptional regulator [Amycolatopsis acididurans]
MAEARGAAGNTDRAARRVPVQRRSRERVARILDAAADLVVEAGIEALGTRAVAARAGVPIGSLYQYFADRDEIILELVRRDTAEMDEAVARAVAALERPTMRNVVEATMRAFVGVYHHRPAFVVIWWRGRTNAAVQEFCRAHNREIAAFLFAFAQQQGMLRDGTDPVIAELAVEVGDRVFQLAFEHDLHGDERIIAEGIDLVTGYLERHTRGR